MMMMNFNPLDVPGDGGHSSREFASTDFDPPGGGGIGIGIGIGICAGGSTGFISVTIRGWGR